VTAEIGGDWVSRFADEVIAEADRRNPGAVIVCASGLSPSGPIHLGNLREVMTPHLVADEIKRRGRDCVHLLSWDDFDRFRKVPAGIDGVGPEWHEQIGRPLTAVPAPAGSSHPNWAEHFKAPMAAAMASLGIEVREVSQTRMYTGGAYREQVLLAMRERARIDAVLARYRTRKPAAPAEGAPDDAPAEGAADDGPADDEDGAGSGGYFPYRPYCSACDKDFTVVQDYDDTTTELSYKCTACGHSETVLLREHTRGKLVWKVDWPMRWAFEGVAFEPSGVDHTSPGSSFDVGSQLVRAVFGAEPPIGPRYAFVGISGMAKMSSSKGGVPTAADALEIMEPPLLRWLYARRRPNQSFTVALDAEVLRLYDEWDALQRKVIDGSANEVDVLVQRRATSTATGPLPGTPRPVPMRTLTSILDVTTGEPGQTLRILHDLDPADPITDLDQARPRLDCAQRWVTGQLPVEQRTAVRTEPDAGRLAALDEQQRRGLGLLLAGLAEHWSLDGLTTLVYGVPKQLLGLPADTAPSPELKAAQRSFFVLLYELLVGRDTGPRLPTLLLAVGADRVRRLLTPPPH